MLAFLQSNTIVAACGHSRAKAAVDGLARWSQKEWAMPNTDTRQRDPIVDLEDDACMNGQRCAVHSLEAIKRSAAQGQPKIEREAAFVATATRHEVPSQRDHSGTPIAWSTGFLRSPSALSQVDPLRYRC